MRRLEKSKRTVISFLEILGTSLILLAGGCSKPVTTEQEIYRQAMTRLREGDLEEAHSLLERQKSLWQDGTSTAAVDLRLLKSEVLLAQGRAREALPLIEKPVSDAPRARSIRQSIDRCDALLKLGRFREAADLLAPVAKQAESLQERDLFLRATALQGAAAAYSRNFPQAEQFLLHALRLAEAQHDDYNAAVALINLTYCRGQVFRHDEAIQFGQRALAAAERVKAKRWIGAALGNLALSYAQLGDFDRAAEAREKALHLQEQMKDRRLLQQSLGETGNLHLLRGDAAKAAHFYRRGYDLAVETRSANDASKWSSNLAHAYILAGDWKEAETWNETSRRLKMETQDTESLPHVELNAAEIAGGRGDFAKAEKGYLRVIRESAKNPGLLWSAHAGLAGLYANAHKLSQADKHFQATLKIIDTTRAELLQSEYKITFLSRLIGFYQQYVDALMERGDGREALRVAESSRGRILAERLGAKGGPASGRVEEFQQVSGRKGVTLVSYWLAPRRSFAWLITPSKVQWFQLPPQAELDSLVAEYRKTVEESVRDPLKDEAGRKLAKALLAPAASLAPGSRVIVVPDGSLHRLNLETLPSNGHYWLEDVTLSVAPSLSALATPPVKKGSPTLPLLALGDPETEDARFPKLEYAKQEMTSLSRRFSGSIYEGARATPAAYLAAKPERFRLVHFAAHAEANAQRPLESAIILSKQADRYRLLAREVMEHPLSADLVTISGCRSAGIRAYSGEGLIGFAWAFLQTGAKAVIAGLWDVSDRGTAVLMDGLYERLAAGDGPPAALREAKLALIRTGGAWRKPYYWAPFQVYVR